jgi:hypothetical protein
VLFSDFIAAYCGFSDIAWQADYAVEMKNAR